MDEKARSIILKAYWGSSGWKDGEVSKEDFEYCRQHGVMFRTRTFKHADLVRRTIAARDAVSPELVGQAFIASLASRKLWLRSALGSYSNCRDLAPHRFRPNPNGQMTYCEQCEASRQSNEKLNTLNFERIKWGGVRHGNLLYNMMDLELLANEPPIKPTSADRKMFKAFLRETKGAAKVAETTGKLKNRWKSIFPTNSQELDTLFCLLSIGDVIEVDGSKIISVNTDLLDLFFQD